MKKLTILFLCFLYSFYLHGQKIGVFSGINTMGFYPGVLDEGATFSRRIGMDIGICIEDLTADNFRIALKLDNYKGCYQESFSTQGGGYSALLNINKLVLTLQAFPLNFKLFTNLRMNIGGECSCLVLDATTGNRSLWQIGTSPYQHGTSSSQHFDEGTWDGNKRISAGIITRFAYEVALSEEWFFTPQFLFYMGMTDEFKKTIPARTVRSYLEIGLVKKLTKKNR
jgi:hypothetical protein